MIQLWLLKILHSNETRTPEDSLTSRQNNLGLKINMHK